jgi:hypothetical protein
MTDLPNSTPDGETPAGDPELAALVRRDAPPDDADPSLAALVNLCLLYNLTLPTICSV